VNLQRLKEANIEKIIQNNNKPPVSVIYLEVLTTQLRTTTEAVITPPSGGE